MLSFHIIPCGSKRIAKSDITLIDEAAMFKYLTLMGHEPVVMKGSHAFTIGLQEKISMKKQVA